MKVIEGPFINDSPIFVPKNDPFVFRFRVRPLVWLDIDNAIPIRDDVIWNSLSFTQRREKSSGAWTGRVRADLVGLDDGDGEFLADRLVAQLTAGKPYPLDREDAKRIARKRRAFR